MICVFHYKVVYDPLSSDPSYQFTRSEYTRVCTVFKENQKYQAASMIVSLNLEVCLLFLNLCFFDGCSTHTTSCPEKNHLTNSDASPGLGFQILFHV